MLRFPWTTGEVFQESSAFPVEISLWDGGPLHLPTNGTHFGFVYSGPTQLNSAVGSFDLLPGMYFSLADEVQLSGGKGIVCTRLDANGFFQIGGPIENQGRLRYIDGCSDSLLVSPVVRGDPCLNLLHIPPGIDQTEHTHPSLRAGLIVSGSGTCQTGEKLVELEPGTVFVIRANSLHSFHTQQEALRVIAWHPDSDTGPSHDDHPMVNRTMVDGIPAAKISEIRT